MCLIFNKITSFQLLSLDSHLRFSNALAILVTWQHWLSQDRPLCSNENTAETKKYFNKKATLIFLLCERRDTSYRNLFTQYSLQYSYYVLGTWNMQTSEDTVVLHGL